MKKNDLEKIVEKLKEDLVNVNNTNDLNEVRSSYLSKKGLLNEFSLSLASMDIDDKKKFGKLLNDYKSLIADLINNKLEELKNIELLAKLEKSAIDTTLDVTSIPVGVKPPLTRVTEELTDLFVSMGYDLIDGPEIESDLYNFEMLNIAKDHPARDTQDTFYINSEMLLRTQTSGVQARTMEANTEKSPIRIICPGKVYRRDEDDATHSHQFMQFEALLVDKDISVANLKETLLVMAKSLFGEEREIRLRPHHFPFTEPSFEIDVSCFKCGGKDSSCPICKGSGWIEILGSGIVHPNVLKSCGYDPEVYTGLALGVGIERVAMLKYGITDIRSFYTNDLRFIDNFNRVKGE